MDILPSPYKGKDRATDATLVLPPVPLEEEVPPVEGGEEEEEEEEEFAMLSPPPCPATSTTFSVMLV
jgi:hypothetical protein